MPRARDSTTLPTPPLAPRTSTVSSALTWATSVTVRHAVTPAMPTAAAARRSTPSGTSMSAPRGTIAALAHKPSRIVPRP
jgi:hypothetical protein